MSISIGSREGTRTSDAELYQTLVQHQSTKNITEISITNCTFGKQSITILLAIIKNNSAKFQMLEINGCDLTTENASKIITGLDSFWRFQQLALADRKREDEKHNPFLLKGFSEVTKDTIADCLRLDLSHIFLQCRACSYDAQIFVPLIQQTSSLKEVLIFFYWDIFRNKMFFTALKKNTTIKKISLPYTMGQGFFEEFFEENRTIEVSYPFQRYGHLNKLCKELGISEAMRKSVPKELEMEQDIRNFLIQLKHAEQWRKLKMVFLGHGEVGKTTLLNAIKNVLKDRGLPNTLAHIARTLLNDSRVKPPKKIDSHDRTVGVDVSALQIGTGEASVWDFGGQLEYAVTHQFLLSIEMVVYILCYDYSSPEPDQQNQISYWLDFLQSTLPTSQPTTKWHVLIVGTKSDQCKTKPIHFTLPISAAWEKLWPTLPLHESQYIVSSHKMKGVDVFLDALENICKTMFENHSILVPMEYNSLVDSLKKIPPDQYILPISQLEATCSWGNPDQFQLAFKYLHGIGHVVLLNDALVCLHPQAIPKIMAEFVSPEAVRCKLMTNHRVTIMNRRQIGVVLNVSEHDKELDDKLALMEYIGVCFKLTNTSQTSSSFLFPSLSSYSDVIQFTVEKASEYVKYAGLRITAPTNKVFTSAFFCLVIVQFCLALSISEQELVVVHKNGIVVKCSGIFLGQLLVKLEEEMKSIVVLMLTYNPILNFASHTIRQLIQEKFQQYDGYEECQLCPLCIQPNLRTEEIPPTERQREFCLKHEMHIPHAPFLRQLSLQNKCKSHNRERHHIFVSYRVDAEGKQSPFTLEGSGGFVELVYWQLAPQKCQHLSPSPPPPSPLLPPNSPNLHQAHTSPPSLSAPISTASSSSSSFTSPIPYGPEIFVFWDKMCLNDGCDWEDGFLHGITSSVVIVLLISNKVIDGICASAPSGQDNVLVEYECALLQNRKCGTPVIPVFVAEKDQNGNFVAFNFGKANQPLPTTPHARKTRAKDMIAKLSDSLPPQRVEFLTSVAKTLDEIFHLQGIFMNKRGEDQAEMKELTKRVLDVLQKYLPQYHM